MLHQRAERLAGRAGELLELSPETRVRVAAKSTYDLPNNYFLRLSETADTQTNPDGWPDSNSSALYIYQQPDVESEDCSHWPYLYCDIQALRTGKFEGRINIPLEKDEILVNVSPYSPIHHLLSV